MKPDHEPGAFEDYELQIDLAQHGDAWFRFHTPHYLRHNQRRQEHLATLGLPLVGRSVLEVGAGIGDHTSFLLDRGCRVTSTDARQPNLDLLKLRYPRLDARLLDLDAPPTLEERWEVAYAYGVLYHLARPEQALAWLAADCTDLLVLETCVSFGDEDEIHFFDEPPEFAENSVHARGNRPSRRWLQNRLMQHFMYVYQPLTQPWHEEFPLDWTTEPDDPHLCRTLFVASRAPLTNPLLREHLVDHPTRG